MLKERTTRVSGKDGRHCCGNEQRRLVQFAPVTFLGDRLEAITVISGDTSQCIEWHGEKIERSFMAKREM